MVPNPPIVTTIRVPYLLSILVSRGGGPTIFVGFCSLGLAVKGLSVRVYDLLDLVRAHGL